jgi:hypothetical protein
MQYEAHVGGYYPASQVGWLFGNPDNSATAAGFFSCPLPPAIVFQLPLLAATFF